MYRIISNFEGGNIKVLSQTQDAVNISVELRDTTEDWFYWCFKVENASGRTITFNFENKNRVGYYGPAISYDYKNWHWQYSEKGDRGGSFTYTFDENENEVYFAHDILYRPERFFKFAEEKGIEIKTLCTTKKGNDVPYFDIGEGEETIFLTARHHACESTGSYVLEGAVEEILSNEYFKRYRIICVPFVDHDGVIYGDQGKCRKPYDHNRDYDETVDPIYKTTEQIRNMAKELNIKYAFDFHSPWHLGGENDKVVIPISVSELVEPISRFSKILEGKNTADALPHYEADNKQPNTGWNQSSSPTCTRYFIKNGAKLALILETPYFSATDISFSVEKAKNLGRNFAITIKDYENTEDLK